MPVAVNPPTDPGLANRLVPKVTVKVSPAVDPDVVPVGVRTGLKSLDIFAMFPGAFSAF